MLQATFAWPIAGLQALLLNAIRFITILLWYVDRRFWQREPTHDSRPWKIHAVGSRIFDNGERKKGRASANWPMEDALFEQ